MPVITKITQQKRDSERYNIYLDEKYSFSVHESILVKYGMTKGMQLDEWSMDEITYEDQIAKAFNRALHFLSFKMRSESEVKKKLLDLEYGEAVVLEAIVKLKRLGFLDDEAFSEAVMLTQKNTSGKGPKAIKQELMKKGVGKELQEQVLEQYSEEEQFAVAKKLAEKAARSNRSIPPAQLKQRIQNALARKGYGFGLINSVLEEIDFEREEDEWDDITVSVGEKAWRRYASKHTGYQLRNRVKQAMYQKGIPLEKIALFIEKKENEDDGE